MLVGRDHELSRLRGLLKGAVAHRGGALVLSGEVGIGKTALLGATTEIARSLGMAVRVVTGVEHQDDVPYAGLAALIGDLAHRLGGLPATQADSLAGALALADHPVAPLAVRAGLLGLLADEAERAPLLVVVDDAQWLDRSSLDALLFCAHRLDHDPVALLLALRTGDEPEPETGRLARLEVGGLDADAAQQLLSAAQAVHRGVAEQCWQATSGNPLALIELTATLTTAQRLGREPLADPLPVGIQLGPILRRRIDAMPPATRLALLVAAAEGDGDLGAIRRALAAMDGSLDDFAPAERSMLVSLDGATLSWRHPLFRSVVYHAPSAPERRAVHRSIAAALDPTAHHDRYVWHLALAADGPDDAVASRLATVAQRARRRGACFSAARAHERAARLCGDPEQRARYLYEAGCDLWQAGASEPSLAYFSATASLTDDDDLRAANATVWGQAELWVHGVQAAVDLLEGEAERVRDLLPARAVMLWCHLVNVHLLAMRMDRAVDAGRRAVELAAAMGPTEQVPAAIACGAALQMRGARSQADELLDPLHELVESVADTDLPGVETLSQVLAIADIARERWGPADELLARTIRRGRRLGMQGAVSFALAQQSDLQWRTGHWAEAYAAMTELVQLADDAGQIEPMTIACAYLSRIEAGFGLAEDCRAHATLAIERAEPRGLHALSALARSSLGMLALGSGDAREALRWLTPLAAEARRGGADDPGTLWWRADWVEALWRVGDGVGAHRALADLETLAAATGSGWALAAAARGRGLMDDTATSRDHLEASVAGFDHLGCPFERARSELCLGERLSAAGDAHAHRHLDRAADAFAQLGATAWVSRADTLRRGAVASDPLSDLTPSERRVALAVGQGLSNRETAERLYVSVKTIDYHLQNIYRKLDVRTRGQLAALMHARSGS